MAGRGEARRGSAPDRSPCVARAEQLAVEARVGPATTAGA